MVLDTWALYKIMDLLFFGSADQSNSSIVPGKLPHYSKQQNEKLQVEGKYSSGKGCINTCTCSLQIAA